MLKEIRSESERSPAAGRRSGPPSTTDGGLGRIKIYLALGAGAVIVLTVLAFVLALKILFFIAAPLLLAVAVGGVYIFLHRKLAD